MALSFEKAGMKAESSGEIVVSDVFPSFLAVGESCSAPRSRPEPPESQAIKISTTPSIGSSQIERSSLITAKEG